MPQVRNAGKIREKRQRLDKQIAAVAVSLVGVFASIVFVTLP